MKVEMEKETICINKLVEQKTENIMIEGDLIVPDIKPDIVSSIHTNGNICIYKKEYVDGKIRIDGSINTYVVYLADTEDGNVRGLNTNLDFTKWIELSNPKNNLEFEMEFQLKTMECNVLNGRKINIKSYIEVKVKTFQNEEVEILKNLKNLSQVQKLNKSMTINSLIGKGSNKAYAKDTIVLEETEKFAEILKVNVEIVNKDFKISYNKILAKAELETKMLYLMEDGKIKSVEKQIPIMGFIDIPNIAEENICDVHYGMRNLVVKPNDSEENSIYVEAEIEIDSNVYENREIDLIQDLYSPEQDLKIEQKRITTMTGLQKIKEDYTIKQKIENSGIKGNKIYDACVIPNIQNIVSNNGTVKCEGEVMVDLLYESDLTIKMDNKKINIPFHYEIQQLENMEEKRNIEVQVGIKQQNVIILSDEELELQIELEFDMKIAKTVGINVIDTIEAEENRVDKIYSIIIYFVKEGDSLWKIAKRFRSTVQDIVELNGIENENQIFPGQQLLIPRYIVRNNVVSV